MTRTLALALCVTLVPAIAGADDEPPGEEIKDPVNAPVFATGALVFLGSYGTSVGVATARLHESGSELYVPIAGPWLALGDWCPLSSSCEPSVATRALLLTDGLVQAAGLVIMLEAIFEPGHHRARPCDRCVHVAPRHDGVMVFGRF